MTIGERIKKLRRFLDLTQQEFADRLGVSRGNIGAYETDRSNVGPAAFSLICRTFNVSEAWLRDGEGGEDPVFVKRDRLDELETFVADLETQDPDFRHRLLTILAKFRPEQWELLEEMVQELSSQIQRNPITPPETEDTRDWRDKHPSEWTDRDEEIAVEEFRQQWREEKNRGRELEPAGDETAG